MIRLLSFVVGLLPARWTVRIGTALGWFAFSVLRVRRRVTVDNLQQALGIGREDAVRMAGRVYRHLATGALELLQVHRLTREGARELLGDLGPLDAELQRGKGLLVLTGHVGHWDLLACAAGLRGVPLHVVSRSIKARWINRFWMARRRQCGVTLLPSRGSARALLGALRRNEVVALVLDQHDPEGTPLPFFGRCAATSTALARLARASGAAVLPVFLVRDAGPDPRAFRVITGPAIRVPRGADPRQDVLDATVQFNRILEQVIRAHPDQWLWLHRRWKVPSVARRPVSSAPRA